jgi:hypothetical protein
MSEVSAKLLERFQRRLSTNSMDTSSRGNTPTPVIEKREASPVTSKKGKSIFQSYFTRIPVPRSTKIPLPAKSLKKAL